jgi:hypothetical protein
MNDKEKRQNKCINKCDLTKIATERKEFYFCLSCNGLYPVKLNNQ